MTNNLSLMDDITSNIELLDLQSRSFAIPLKRLDDALKIPIICQYNINKLFDIIEDNECMSISDKVAYMDELWESIKEKKINTVFLQKILDYCSAETDFFRYYPQVICLYQQLTQEEQALGLEACRITKSGMQKYLQKKIMTISDVNDYCYYVAGVVGEYLTNLFFYLYDKTGSAKQSEFLELSILFGGFLQKINNIRDYYEDTHIFKKERWPEETLKAHTLQETLNILCKDCLINNGLPAIQYLAQLPDLNKSYENFIRYILYSGLFYMNYLVNNMDVLKAKKVKVPKRFMIKLYDYIENKSRPELLKEMHFLYEKGLKKIPMKPDAD